MVADRFGRHIAAVQLEPYSPCRMHHSQCPRLDHHLSHSNHQAASAMLALQQADGRYQTCKVKPAVAQVTSFDTGQSMPA